ncbi:MAG: PASTA domain-containing protein [Vicinamibacteria bacterium]
MTIKRFAVLLMKNGLLLATLFLTAGGSAVLTMRALLTAQEVVVPSLIDKRVPEAGALSSRAGLLVRVEGRRNDPRIRPDRIVAQEPLPGAPLKAHRSIRVWVSLGPRRQNVPAVEGQTLRTARLVLDHAQVPVARVAEVDSPSEEGTILVQRPAAGDVDALAEGISLLVSRGRGGRDYVMPDLIGRKAEAVIDGLREAGLKVADVRYRTYPGLAPGIVLRQSPASGHRVSPQSTVSLDISKASS